ncbi:nucleoside hydrolase [Teichococcus vastitatis]|uniref:Nucleoside hydrolase n=1 Tax=Teichococcus vastitatis TaxID=2307076 RepID=A0ABS9W3X2_9PROT|nr:nucleoside hydrolase [Pseudoroseomonas vastitatis]MCI0753309.1 nucleoside hydrolase [Pseudoroseomonas vastitatis]
MARKIIIDTDPGKDDAVAILLALASPELEVLALTAVAGNVPLSRTEANARQLLELGGRPDIPVYPGCMRPLVRNPVTAEHVHGETGLQGLVLPEPATPPRPGHAVDAMIDMLRQAAPGEITLCLLGPATNLAMALVKAPDIAARVAEVIWMAGARSEGGNVTPAAEYNVHADPDAAEVLLNSGIALTLLPLDLTHQVRLTRERLTRLRMIGTAAARAVAVMFSDADGTPQREREQEGIPLHDPCVIAWLLRPGLFSGRRINVQVETGSPLALGMTVADWFGVSGRAANATWLNQADAAGFFDLLLERLARLP